ncbi:hypothetical protein PHYBOEH_005114 [Phytophthora boehmeriae]|uniref:Uncharacterized protein n=1 Tax=Phytophthora boehmeriae TaxID=109152 RepID=A0A8T1X4N3_9STRA|nr:hypothetical protein PHYBOEH_005114 [Phytophthora boehmeriae]
MSTQGGDGSSKDSPRLRSKQFAEDPQEVETHSDSHDQRSNSPPPLKHQPSAKPPSLSAMPPDTQGSRRKRSSLLLQTIHPDAAKESASFVDNLPQLSTLRVLLTLFAYALLLSDVPRGGASVESLPYTQLEPNVFAVYGPETLAARKIFRNGTTITNGTSGAAFDVSTAFYKYAPSSYGLRTARDLLDTSSLDAAWPKCLLSCRSPASWYSTNCGDTLPGTTVFAMLDSLADALAANAASTTSYKSMAQTEDGIEIMARGELSALPQRVCFAARSKARWTGISNVGSGVTAASSSTSFLSRNLLDHKYWLGVWATVFADLDPANPGVDLCVDDLDRPLLCEKPWAAPQYVEGTLRTTPALWETVSLRVAELQVGLAKSEKLDITLVETESDPLTRLGGAVLLAHKLYSVVILYRVRECTDDGACITTAIFDERVEGKVLYTDGLEWSPLAATLRYIGQVYIAIRLACLLVACFAAVDQNSDQKGNVVATPIMTRLKRAVRVFFAVPSQVVVYGSWVTVACYASAHIIDGLMRYELEDYGVGSATESFSSMTCWLAVHMRSVWLMGLFARIRALLQTSAGAWTPGHGVSGVRGHLLPALALGAVVFVVRGGISVDDRDARILEANEVEPITTFMLLRAETLDAWKMNLEGVYSDLLSLALAAVIYVFVILTERALLRSYRRRMIKPTNATQGKPQDRLDAVPEPLFFARSAVPSAAGALWEPSCLSVSWDDDLLAPLINLLAAPKSWKDQLNRCQPDRNPDSTGDAGSDANAVAGHDGVVTSSTTSVQRMLMNLVFLSDPWNLLVLKLGRARVHLYHLRRGKLDCKVVHAQTKARVAREYSLGPEHVELIASLRASELSWGQLITCK